MFIGGIFQTNNFILSWQHPKILLPIVFRISITHFIHNISSAVSKEGQTAPRSGFFHNFRTKEVLVKKYNPEQETFEDVHDEETIHRLQSNLKNLDRNLGAYPYDSWKKWVSLSNKISIETIQR